MRILASADLHGFTSVAAWLVEMASAHQTDAIVLAGDLLGVPDGPPTVEEAQRESGRSLEALFTTAGIPVLYVMGNDDQVEWEPSGPLFRSLHGRRVTLEGLHFVGYQYCLPFMGGIFEKTEAGILDDLPAVAPLLDDHTVLVTHSPACGSLDGDRLGSTSIRQMVARCNVLAHIHGHIHRCFGRDGRHFNAAAAGQRRAVLLDLPSLEHQLLYGENLPCGFQNRP